MRRYGTLFGFLFLTLLCGCPASKPVANNNPTTSSSQPRSQDSPASTPSADSPLPSGVFDLSVTEKPLTADEKQDAAISEAMRLIGEKKWNEAQETLQQVQSGVATETAREQMTRLASLKARQSAFEQTTSDIQAILESGQTEKANELITEAMGQFNDAEEMSKLMALRRQADALLTVKTPAVEQTQVTRYRQQAESALKENNLRAAAMAYEQAVQLAPSSDFTAQANQTIEKLNRYDTLRQRGSELRRVSSNLEEAYTSYQEASTIWDTPQIRQDMADVQLALQKRRPRLAIVDFEVRGNLGVAKAGKIVSEELLAPFKSRYDLVEQSQLKQVMNQLSAQASDIYASETARSELAKLAKAQFLVVGSVSEVGGVVINARLIDLRNGLIVQTGKVVASTFQEALRKLPSLGNMLQMNDNEKLAYEKRLSADAAPPVLVQANAILPSVPAIRQGGNMPPAIVAWSNRPPLPGVYRGDDFNRFPPMPTLAPNASPPPAPVLLIEQERPLRSKLLRIQLELGDNLFIRGKYLEAHARYKVALDIDPLHPDIRARVDLCQPYLPPVVVHRPAPIPVIRERVAFLNFMVMTSDPILVPGELSTWLPDQMSYYFNPPFDVVERGELYWYMGRLGMTVADVIRDPMARKWLGRVLGARYFVIGQVENAAGIVVTSRMIDAEFGWEVGKAQAIARDTFELKMMLGDLARSTYLAPRPTEPVLVLDQDADYLRACELARQNQYAPAIEIVVRLKKKFPGYIRLGVIHSRWEEEQRRFALEQARKQEMLRQERLAADTARRQAELTMAVELARQEAARRQAIADADRIRQRDLAHQKMLSQARLAIEGKRFSFAIQLCEGALAIRPDDPPTLRELTLARSKAEEERRRMLAEDMARKEEALRRQREAELAAARQALMEERNQHTLELNRLALVQSRAQQDNAEYTRLLDQAQKLKAAAQFDSAVEMLQTAKRVKPGSEVDRLLTDALMEHARSQAKAEDAAKRAELERRLAQEESRRAKAETEAKRNQQLYQTALQAARDAHAKKDWITATSKYKQAQSIFQTDEVLTALQTIQQEEETKQLAEKTAAESKKKQQDEYAKLIQAGKAALQQKNWSVAIHSFESAMRLLPEQTEAASLLTQAKFGQEKALAAARQQEMQNQVNQLTANLRRANDLAKAGQFDAALALLGKVPSPSDPILSQQLESAKSTIRKQQTEASEAVALARRKQEDAIRLEAVKRAEAEKNKKEAIQAVQDAKLALASSNLEKAISSIKQIQKLAPNDPNLPKLQADLAVLQSQLRTNTERQAKAQLEARQREMVQATSNQNAAEVTKLLNDARASIDSKEFDKAEKLLAQAGNLDPTNLSIGKTQRELAQTRDAFNKQKANMAAEAKKKTAEQEAKTKIQFDELVKNGKTALTEGDNDQAVKFFESALKLKPENTEVPLLLGMANRSIEARKKEAEMAKKKQEEEEAAKKKAEEEAKAMARKEAEAKKKADEELKKKLEADREAKKKAELAMEQTKTKFQAAILAGNLALASKKYDEAIASYQSALQLMPENAEAKKLLDGAKAQQAQAMAPNKTDSKSNSNFKTDTGSKSKTDSKTPASTELFNQAMSKGTAARGKNDWKTALEYYQEALKLKPDDKIAKELAILCTFQLKLEEAKSLLKARKTTEAIKELEAALKLIPNHAEATKLLKQAKESK